MYNSSCFRFRIVLYVLNQILNIERFVFILFYFLFCDIIWLIVCPCPFSVLLLIWMILDYDSVSSCSYIFMYSNLLLLSPFSDGLLYCLGWLQIMYVVSSLLAFQSCKDIFRSLLRNTYTPSPPHHPLGPLLIVFSTSFHDGLPHWLGWIYIVRFVSFSS